MKILKISELKSDKNSLLLELQRFYKENKRSPIYSEMNKKNGYSHGSVYIRIFSSWINALKEAGLTKKRKKYVLKHKETIIDDNLLRFFGYWLAEGDIYIDKDNEKNKRNGNQIKLSLNIHDIFINDIKQIIKEKLNKNVSESYDKRNSNILRLLFRDEGFANYITKTFGKGSSTKKIPVKFLGLNDNNLINLIKGLILGDGTESEVLTSLNTTSPSMAQFMYLSLIKLGFYPTLVTVENQKEKYGSFGNKKQYRISVMGSDNLKKLRNMTQSKQPIKNTKTTYNIAYDDEDYVYMSIQNIKKERYKGDVYNLEVDKSETYCSPMITMHNCENFYISNSNRYSEKWADFRFLCTLSNLLNFNDFITVFKKGELSSDLEKWIIDHKDINEDSGDSEIREMYILYYDILHPNKLNDKENVSQNNLMPDQSNVKINMNTTVDVPIEVKETTENVDIITINSSDIKEMYNNTYDVDITNLIFIPYQTKIFIGYTKDKYEILCINRYFKDVHSYMIEAVKMINNGVLILDKHVFISGDHLRLVLNKKLENKIITIYKCRRLITGMIRENVNE